MEVGIGRFARHVAALLGAAVGYFAGLAAAIAALGLTAGAAAAPLSTLAVGGLGVGVVLGLHDGRRRLWSRVAWGTGPGLLLGLACWAAEPPLEWCVGALVLLSQALAWRSGPTRRS